MKENLGDILPQISDDCRYNIIQHRVSYYKKILICEKCRDVNKQSKCNCKKTFNFFLELLKSNFPQTHFDILNEELFDRRVAEINLDESDKKNKKPFSFNEVVDFFIENSEEAFENSLSMLLTGNNETGKTYGSLYILAQLIKSGWSGHYIRFKNYLNLLNSSYNDKEDKILLRQIREVKFLIVDELGKEHGRTDYATCELEELIKTRQDNLCSTFMITNLDFQDFVETYGNHVKSAFNKNFKVLLFHPDAGFRKKTRVKWDLRKQ